MSLVGYEYDDTSSTPKKKKEKQKPLKRASTSLVEYHLPEDSNEFHETTTGHDSEVIIENQNHEDEEDESEEEEEDTQESPLEDPFADNDIGLKSESFSSVKSPDFSGLKSSDYSGLKNSDFNLKSSESFSVLRVSDAVLSPKAESPSKRQKTDYSDWKNDYEGPLEPPCPLLVDKVAEYRLQTNRY
jgi:hypothetical protein